jgi:general secretion pathway protein I
LRRAENSDPAGHEAGFTILEVLIAIAVVAIVLGAIGGVVASTTRGVRSIEQHVALMETARSVAAGLRSREPLASGQASGELLGNRWQIGASPLMDGPVAVDSQATWIPQHMTMRVQSPSGAAVAIETIRLQRRR